MDNRIFGFGDRLGASLPVDISSTEHPANDSNAIRACTQDLYTAAWAKARRDHELDRLFNAEFYYEI